MINFALTEEEAQALQQVIGESVQKSPQTEDTKPLLALSFYLSKHGFHWTDETSGIYWWASSLDKSAMYGEGTMASPVFKCREDALEWVTSICPRETVYLFSHFGRGIQGPHFKWDAELPWQTELEELTQ